MNGSAGEIGMDQLFKVKPTLAVGDVIQLRRDRVRRGEYRPLGRMITVVIEAARGAQVPQAEAAVFGVRLDWGTAGPPLGISYDSVDLLVLAAVPPLPDIPDPGWQRPGLPDDATPKQVARWRALQPPMIQQRLADRASARVRGSNFLVFHPVAQILFKPEGVPLFSVISGMTDETSGTKLALLIDPMTGEAHFYGGRFRIG